MSEAQELDTTGLENKEESSARPMSAAVDEEDAKKSSKPDAPDSRKTESATLAATENAEVEPRDEPNNTTSSTLRDEKKEQENAEAATLAPTSKTLDRTKPGECNLLPVLVERLRSALEQSCSSQSSEEPSIPTEDSGVDSEEDLRAWASGLCSTADQQRREEAQSPRGLKLDLKFLEDLLLSDIQTALGRLQETLKRVDIGTLTRYSSTLDPTNKLNLLKLISSLLANLKIPEEAAKPERTAKGQSSLARRRRADRHTIGVSSEELARARKWLEEKSLGPSVVEPSAEPPLPQLEDRRDGSSTALPENSASHKDAPLERLEEKQFDKVREKHMKDAINQQQSLQSKSKEPVQRETGAFYEPPQAKLIDAAYKDDNSIINEEYGISASSLYHQSNAQAKCNKFLAKKSKIKRANTIDIPNYLKLQAESLANGRGGCVSLRRPINIGDKYLNSVANAVPSFEPKTENDRKFLALISKNNETSTAAPSASLPFKSFNYRQAMADKNWNSRFSNIKTTFDKPQDENTAPRSAGDDARRPHSGEQGLVLGALRLPCNGSRQKPGFSHAPTSPFQKIEKLEREDLTPGFLKPGYTPKSGSLLQAKVKMFDQESANSQTPTALSVKSRAKQLDPRRGSNLFAPSDDQTHEPNARATENGHLNYHSFCKQFAPFASKNPAEHKANPWSSGNIVSNSTPGKANAREKFQKREKMLPGFGEDNRGTPKVPVAYLAGNRFEKTENRDKKEKPRHRKLYETYEGPGEANGLPAARDVVAYPFEVNYQKRPSFGKKFRDNAAEKGDYEDPEVLQQPRSPPPALSSLQYLKSILPSARNPSPPPRSVFSVQSVAVQTNQSEPPRPVYPKENPTFPPRDDNSRRPAPPPPPKDPSVQGRLPQEQPRRGSRQYNEILADPYEPSPSALAPPRRDELAAFVAADTSSNYIPIPAQGRPQLPQSVGQETNYPQPESRCYAAAEPKQYSQNSLGQTAPQVPMRANPPQRVSQLVKKPQEPVETFERYDKRACEEFEGPERVAACQEYPTSFGHDSVSQNPIYVPPRPAERDALAENGAQATTLLPQAPSYGFELCHPEDPRSLDDPESADISEEHSFADDENIQNQDISSEGVVTRYTCAIATVSSASESPAVSPQPPPLKEPEERRPSRTFENNSRDFPSYRDERSRESAELSLEEIRRHNLLQQSLIRQLQGESLVAKTARRLSSTQETNLRDESSPLSPLNFPQKLPDEQRPDEPVIESNNTQEKINIFEGRNNSIRKQQQQHFNPLSVTRAEREAFVPPKINVVSPSKVFKPSFADARIAKASKPSQKSVSPIDSSDEYLMSCASKPSRSIVLSKSESWHQLAMSKSTLQVPQAQPGSLLKPPKPKSPSSLRLSKQYEASSSSDAIRKMEEKIQRYFQGPQASGQPDSPVAARRDPKTKRNFVARRSQGSLVRSATMPHIFDESTDVEKAFDSLFKEATRADDRH